MQAAAREGVEAKSLVPSLASTRVTKSRGMWGAEDSGHLCECNQAAGFQLGGLQLGEPPRSLSHTLAKNRVLGPIFGDTKPPSEPPVIWQIKQSWE